MDTLKQWCITVSAVSIVSGVLMYLVPKGGSKSTYRVLVSILLLYVLVSPFGKLHKIDFDFSEIIPDKESVVTDTHEGELYIAQKTYERYIESQLKESVGDVECECICFYSDGELVLKSITIITFVPEEQRAEILQKLEDTWDENTTVLFRSDKDERT